MNRDSNKRRRSLEGAALLIPLLLLLALFSRNFPRSVAPTIEPQRSAGYSVDLNSADAVSLTLLPGIGPALASALIDWRERHGPFRSFEDLIQVRGIGPVRASNIMNFAVLGEKNRSRAGGSDEEMQRGEDRGNHQAGP